MGIELPGSIVSEGIDSADAIDERVFQILAAEDLAPQAHSIGIGSCGKDAAQIPNKRIIHRSHGDCRLPVNRNSSLFHGLIDFGVPSAEDVWSRRSEAITSLQSS